MYFISQGKCSLEQFFHFFDFDFQQKKIFKLQDEDFEVIEPPTDHTQQQQTDNAEELDEDDPTARTVSISHSQFYLPLKDGKTSSI